MENKTNNRYAQKDIFWIKINFIRLNENDNVLVLIKWIKREIYRNACHLGVCKVLDFYCQLIINKFAQSPGNRVRSPNTSLNLHKSHWLFEGAVFEFIRLLIRLRIADTLGDCPPRYACSLCYRTAIKHPANTHTHTLNLHSSTYTPTMSL